MKTGKVLGVILSVALVIGLLAPFVAAQPVVTSNGTEEITITRYDVDGTTVLEQETLTYTEMESLFDVQGDGETHYYFQGPTFDPDNLWDPDEEVNLKNKGAIMGTDIKDLVEHVGGAQAGDQIEIRARDGYGEQYQYDNVYNPEPGQGKMVVAWYTKNAGDGHDLYPEGAYVPEYGHGMQLIFLVETTNADGQHVFGHDDMRTYLPEANWHYFYDGDIQYPSANGLSLKWISEINVFSEAPEPWSIEVTGAVTETISQNYFENALACHEEVEWVDDDGNVWSGLPLWWLVGFADDDIIHGIGSFNDALALEGYDIEVKAGDGYAQEFDSRDVRRSSEYIVANKVNGAPLPEQHYPLRLVGSALTEGAQRVGQIASINLHNIPDIDTWELELSGAYDYTMAQAEFDNAVYCTTTDHGAVYTDADGKVWEGLPLWLLVGWVDDATSHGPGQFNDDLAALGYDVKVIAEDGYSHEFDSEYVARNDDIIVASLVDGEPLTDSYPLRLVGEELSGGQQVSEIAKIELLNLPTLDPDWELELSGATSTILTDIDFQAEAAANPVSWVHPESGDEYTGVALWRLVGMVDDEDPDTFNDALAALDYEIKVIAEDGFSRSVDSTLIARNDDIIVANRMNDEPLPEGEYPLRLRGEGLSSGEMVSMVVRIEIVDLPEIQYDLYLPLVSNP